MTRWMLAFALVGAVAVASPAARADDAAPTIDITVQPHGREWRIPGVTGGDEGSCTTPCAAQLPRGTHEIMIGDYREKLKLERSSDLEYHPGSPGLRWTGGGLALVGLIVTGFAWGAIFEGHSSDETNVPLALTGVGGLAAGIVGGLLFFVSGEYVTVRPR